MAFKMKGNPMQRNFGIGSALKQSKQSKETKPASKEATADPKVGKELAGRSRPKAEAGREKNFEKAMQKEKSLEHQLGTEWYDAKNPVSSMVKNPKKTVKYVVDSFKHVLGK